MCFELELVCNSPRESVHCTDHYRHIHMEKCWQSLTILLMFLQHFMSVDSGAGNQTYPSMEFWHISDLEPGRESIKHLAKVVYCCIHFTVFFSCFLISVHLMLFYKYMMNLNFQIDRKLKYVRRPQYLN